MSIRTLECFQNEHYLIFPRQSVGSVLGWGRVKGSLSQHDLENHPVWERKN